MRFPFVISGNHSPRRISRSMSALLVENMEVSCRPAEVSMIPTGHPRPRHNPSPLHGGAQGIWMNRRILVSSNYPYPLNSLFTNALLCTNVAHDSSTPRHEASTGDYQFPLISTQDGVTALHNRTAAFPIVQQFYALGGTTSFSVDAEEYSPYTGPEAGASTSGMVGWSHDEVWSFPSLLDPSLIVVTQHIHFRQWNEN